jgi:hypothetical protein
MIFNKEVLFLHPVKTGGISLTNFFLSRLKAPIFYVAQKGHHGKYKYWNGVVSLIGNRHGNLPYAENYLKQFANYSLEKFKTIISVVRNPYLTELSRFYYFAKDIEWIDPNAREVILARQGDFECFAKDAPYNYCTESGLSGIQHYFTIDGITPSNMTILRCEHLEEDLQNTFVKHDIGMNYFRGFRNIAKRDILLRPISVIEEALSIMKMYKPYKLPRLNQTNKKKSLEELLTPMAERHIYEKYKWLIDQKFYRRIEFESID